MARSHPHSSGVGSGPHEPSAPVRPPRDRTLARRTGRAVYGPGPTAFTVVEVVVALAVLAALLGISVPLYRALMADRALGNAAHLIQGDLRLAQQAAVSRSGSGPRVEMCLRSTGYEVYAVDYQSELSRDPGLTSKGDVLKSAHAGDEYRMGIAISASASVPCTAYQDGQAVVFSSAGAPLGSDSTPLQAAMTLTLTLDGRSYQVVVAPTTGRITVTR